MNFIVKDEKDLEDDFVCAATSSFLQECVKLECLPLFLRAQWRKNCANLNPNKSFACDCCQNCGLKLNSQSLYLYIQRKRVRGAKKSM